MEVCTLEGIQIARLAVAAASDKQANDIILLDTRKLMALADYFVVCSGESDKQLRAIEDEVEHKLKQAGASLLHQEGTPDSGWILLDYGDVIVHIFSAPERQYYRLEELWNKAALVLRVQ